MRQIYKPLLSLLTALLTCIPALAYDFSAPNADGITIYYNITSTTDMTVAVTSMEYIPSYGYYSDYRGTVVIPEETTYKGTNFTVTSITDHAFNRCSGLTSVTIPNSVTTIGDDAFNLCSGLTSVTIPNSVTEIGINPFKECSSLSAFYGKFASEDNQCLIVDGILCAFAPNNGLTSYSVPNSVTTIGNNAFYDCYRLLSVSIGSSVTKIGNYAFYNCNRLTSVDIPNSVTTIGDYAFYGCYRLLSVTIGSSVMEIGAWAFRSCDCLISIYAKPLAPPACDVLAFEDGHKNNAVLYVPKASLDVYKVSYVWRDFLNIEADTSSITEVTEDEDPDTPAVYYDLNGTVVERPESGNLYIRQKGEKTQKIIY